MIDWNNFTPEEQERLEALKSRIVYQSTPITPLDTIISGGSPIVPVYEHDGLPIPQYIFHHMRPMQLSDRDRMAMNVFYARAANTHHQKFQIVITLHMLTSATDTPKYIAAILLFLQQALALTPENIRGIQFAFERNAISINPTWSMMVEEYQDA